MLILDAEVVNDEAGTISFMPYLSCLTFVSFSFPLSYSPMVFIRTPHRISKSFAFGTLFFVSVAAAGRSWVGFLSVMPACVVIR